MIVIPNIYEESLSSFLGRDSSSLRSSEWQLPWATSLCHSERGRQPFVIPNRDLWSSVRNLLLLTRNGGDYTLAWTEMLRYALHDIDLGWDSSVRCTSEWQANVIPNVCEESPAICLRFFISLRSIQNDRDVIPCEDGRPERNPGKQKLLPSYGRSFKGNRRKGA